MLYGERVDVDAATVSERVFLDDNLFSNDGTRQSPVDLGAFPHQCLGNVTLCPNGFTWAAWYKPLTGNRQVGSPTVYCLYSPSQSTDLS